MKRVLILLIVICVSIQFSCKKDKDEEETYAVRDKHSSGLIFYVDESGKHGLVADFTDLADAEWGCYHSQLSGANGVAIGAGVQNTNDIISECTQADIAALLCHNSTRNGYSDWYLPSNDELRLMFDNLFLDSNPGCFKPSYYWSSTQGINENAYTLYCCGTGKINPQDKSNIFHVRAVRAF